VKLSCINEDVAVASGNLNKHILDVFGIDISYLKPIGSGTFAKVYDVGDGKVLKITRDFNDYKNTIKAGRLHDDSIVKVYKISKFGKDCLMIVDKVSGKNAVYSTPEWHALIYGNTGMDELRDASKNIRISSKDIRSKILSDHGLNTEVERAKLAKLFSVLYKLNSIGISLDDLGDNIMDDGNKYIIVDLGM